MPVALSPFIDHLIPADELSPAASALGVAQRIWNDAMATPDGRMLVERVCQWLDQYGEGFASLDDSEREVLVRWMSQAPWESPQRRFFHLVREQAFTLYYTQPAALKGFPFDRPPQPMGFALD
ncbi:MAG: gluconate 2-dehydrogenase subunit 3 family protein [Aquabacterium sp.]|uniref:gluconate 2-dehydrogenase subunit 3 family protein n=1 Tax=Aquabacterium sp. TaxID=1872578 RepID=UPI00271CC321|nr:gluconate 2-dehydrogenase subunit 3 family protein [Aquabacterium sp.]MDO9003795.1 gluconate 2-dehydrogenase subunit 3 family protein [Aquabacterium sp.]